MNPELPSLQGFFKTVRIPPYKAQLLNALYLSVNVFTPNVNIRKIEDTIFNSPSGNGTAILRGNHKKV